MISAWWLAAVCFAWLLLLVWLNDMSYRHGIWDGAFNHFLPKVKKEMLFYDKNRAEKIFKEEKEIYGIAESRE